MLDPFEDAANMGVMTTVIYAIGDSYETLRRRSLGKYLGAENDVSCSKIGAENAEQARKGEGMRSTVDGLQSDDCALIVGRIQAHDRAVVKTRLDDLAIIVQLKLHQFV